LREILRSNTSRPLETKDIVRAWLNNTPPERLEEFRRIFNEMHGGPLSDFDLHFAVADDYGDAPSDAASLALSEWVHGDLGSVFDVDVFRFRAEEGETYRNVLHHRTVDVTFALKDFYFTLTAADGLPFLLRTEGGGELGFETAWISRRTGDYLLTVASREGTLGPYSVLVGPEDHASDDHANDIPGATPLAIGTRAEGHLGHKADVDFFYIDALWGHSYEVFVGHGSVQYSTVTFFGPPGTAWEDGLGAYREGLKGSNNRWQATETGRYYLAVENPFSTTGAYYITVTETPRREATTATGLPQPRRSGWVSPLRQSWSTPLMRIILCSAPRRIANT